MVNVVSLACAPRMRLCALERNGASEEQPKESDMDTRGHSIVLIAACEGHLKDALRAMLVSMPDVMILEAEDAAQAEAALLEHRPDLVVIDSGLPGNLAMQLVSATQNLKPRARCSILVDNVVQQAAALRAGADRAPLKGEPPERLFAMVEQLLGPSGVHRATA